MKSETIQIPSTDRIEELLSPYDIPADAKLLSMVRDYLSLLLQWNRRLSLTAITDPEEAIRIHFGESMFAAYAAAIDKGRVADIGTGAGFPGIPIRMVRQQVDLTLVESNTKKATFLGEVTRKLQLGGVQIIRSRMEEINGSPTEQFDFVTARALGAYPALLRWCDRNLSPKGRVILFVGPGEADTLSKTPNWTWRSVIHIPESRSRLLLIGWRA